MVGVETTPFPVGTLVRICAILSGESLSGDIVEGAIGGGWFIIGMEVGRLWLRRDCPTSCRIIGSRAIAVSFHRFQLPSAITGGIGRFGHRSRFRRDMRLLPTPSWVIRSAIISSAERKSSA